MKPRFNFAQHRQSNNQNAAAFKMWLAICTDAALMRDPGGIAHSYGLTVADVTEGVAEQMRRRGLVRHD